MANVTWKKILVCCMQNQFLKTTPPPATVLQKCFLNSEVAPQTVSAPETSPLSSFTVHCLMNLCGLPLETALSASRKFQLEENKSQNHESVLSFLRSLQFSNAQITKLVSKRPWILQSKVSTNLKPKLEYLIGNGFVGTLLPELIATNPLILGRSLNAHVKPTIEFLKTYLHNDDKVVAAVKRSSWLLTFNLKGTMQPNIEFLLSAGVPTSNIAKLIMLQPRTILQKVDRMVYAVETIRKLGLEPSAPMFVHAIRVMVSMSYSTWKRKVEMFKSLGWSEEEIMSTFKRDPSCLACSEKKIRSIMDFYVNTMKLDPAVIIAYPKFLQFAINTRIRPRYKVIKLLESKKLLKKDKKIVWMLARSEKDFLKKYVNKHLDQIPNLVELYRGTSTVDKIDI